MKRSARTSWSATGTHDPPAKCVKQQLTFSDRIAALKCRQRKKQWLSNLQAKVELFSTENDALSQSVTQLREEIVNLRSLLLAHRECPVAVQQGLAGGNMSAYLEGNHHNPYGLAQPNGLPAMTMQMPQAGPAGQMQRR